VDGEKAEVDEAHGFLMMMGVVFLWHSLFFAKNSQKIATLTAESSSGENPIP